METIAYIFAVIVVGGTASGCFTMAFAGMAYVQNLRLEQLDYAKERKASIRMISILLFCGAVAVIGLMQIMKSWMGVIA